MSRAKKTKIAKERSKNSLYRQVDEWSNRARNAMYPKALRKSDVEWEEFAKPKLKENK